MMTDLLLVVALVVVSGQAAVTIGVVVWTRLRPRRLMHWAVRRRSEMTLIEGVMFLARRRAVRAFASLSAVLQDELRPALGQIRETLELFEDMLPDAQN